MRGILDSLLACIPVEFTDRMLNRARIAGIRKRLRSCGKGVVISDGFLVERPELVSIGNDVSFGPNVSLMGAGGVAIGNGAMLGTRAVIMTTQHNPKAPFMKQSQAHAPVEIGEFSWIGAGALLLPGVKVGPHAIVGAGAVVTRDVPAYGLAVGVPARTIRDRRNSGAQGEVACQES